MFIVSGIAFLARTRPLVSFGQLLLKSGKNLL